MVALDRVLSPDFLGRQNPLSSVSAMLSSEDRDQRDCCRCGLGTSCRGVPIAMIRRLFIKLSRALSTPPSAPACLYTRGEVDEGVVCMIEDLRRRDGVFSGDVDGPSRFGGELLAHSGSRLAAGRGRNEGTGESRSTSRCKSPEVNSCQRVDSTSTNLPSSSTRRSIPPPRSLLGLLPSRISSCSTR